MTQIRRTLHDLLFRATRPELEVACHAINPNAWAGRVFVGYGKGSPPPPGPAPERAIHVRLHRHDELDPVLRRAADTHRYRFEGQPARGGPTAIHPLTVGAIRALQRLPVEGKTVVDIGTGEGAIALVAARLGARHVIAVDTDPLILAVARRNAFLNGLGRHVVFEESDGLRGDRLALAPDIVVATLPTHLFAKLGPFLDAHPEIRAFVMAGREARTSRGRVDLPPKELELFQSRRFAFKVELVEETGRMPRMNLGWRTLILEKE